MQRAKSIEHLFAALALLALTTSSQGAGDAQRGAQLFRACAACHSLAPGEHLTGPSLAHVWQRKAASAEGFHRYSQALKKSGLVWNEATLDKWLADPAALVPGTSMGFAGLKNAAQREDLIAYLRAASQGEVAARPSGRPDLKTAPARARVVTLRHCGDTYTVETADGQSEKIWEFNLRLKTDSSEHGPAPGKPVAIGAGMRGDRASIVFARPEEISAFIKASCP